MSPIIILIIALWFICGVGGAGFIYAAAQGEFPSLAKRNKRSDAGWALAMGLFGPLTLLIGFLTTGFGEHGWWVWRLKFQS